MTPMSPNAARPAAAAAAASAPPESCDVLVIGGGPGGATIAALLAREGRRVVLLEKAHHPRFHIGESLLPANVPLLDTLGVRQAVEAIGMPKWGVEFVSPDHRHRSFFEFGDAWDKSMPMAWQVRRDAFDEILFRRAATDGAVAIEGAHVKSVRFDADGADVTALQGDGASRHWRARYVVDASGRDTLLANQFGLKRKNAAHNSAALFGHFTGVERLGGKRAGNISIFWFQHGWFWLIPLADGSTSIGAVCWPHYLKTRDRPLKDFFLDTIALSPGLSARLQGATLVDDAVHATGNYAYGSSASSGERYLLVGDAYAFVDPVFSSGVYLAMASAFEGVKVIAATLDAGSAAAPAAAAGARARARARARSRARSRYHRHMLKGPREFSWFIFRMTNPAMRELFMHPANPLRMQEAVLSLLAGDIFGKTPIRASLTLFKCMYWLNSLAALPRTWRALRARAHNIRDVGSVPGENIMARTP